MTKINFDNSPSLPPASQKTDPTPSDPPSLQTEPDTTTETFPEGSSFRAVDPHSLSEVFQNEVRALEAERKSKEREYAESISRQESAEEKYDKVYNNAGWREKHLWHWVGTLLGGNTSTMHQLDALSTEKKDCSAKVEEITRQINEKKTTLYVKLYDELKRTNPEFQELDSVKSIVEDTQSALTSYLTFLDSSCEGADTCEHDITWGIRRYKIGTDVDYEGLDEIAESVEEETKLLEEIISDYNASSVLKKIIQTGHAVDTNLDCSDLYDCQSAENLIDGIKFLEAEARHIENDIDEHASIIEEKISSYIEQAMQICIGGK